MEGGLTDLEVSKEQYKGVEKKLSEVDVQISFYGPDQDQILISETKRVLLRHLVLFFFS